MDNHTQLLQLARDATGLDDFGADSFRERILGHLTQRLLIEELYRRHPEIDEQQIVAPLIGLSLPRTGSTVLAFLLTCALTVARCVMTHRDPAEVILSVMDVYADIVGRCTDHLDMHYLAELNIHQWSDGMESPTIPGA